MATTQRFGGNIEVWGDVFVKTQGATPESAVTRALLDQVITAAKNRANHSGTQLFATISDGATYVDGRIQQVVGAAPAALDTLEEIAQRLADDADAVAAILTQVTANRTDLDALTTRVSSAEADITDLRGDVEALTGTAGGLASQTDLDAAVAALSALTTRVSTAEGRLDGLDASLAALDTRLDGDEERLSTVETDLGDYKYATDSRLGNLDAATDTLRTDLDALGTSGGAATAALRTDLETLRTDLTSETGARTAADTGLQTQVDALDARLTELEIAQIFAVTLGDGASSSFTINHPLNSRDVDVLVREDGQKTFPVDTVTGPGTVTLDFGGYVPAQDSIRVVVKRLGDPIS